MLNHSEWLNSNSNRAYPFKQGMKLRVGTPEIPGNLLVDAVLAGTDSLRKYRVNYIQVGVDYLQIGIADDLGQFHGVANVQTDLPTVDYLATYFQPEVSSGVKGRFMFGPGVQTVAAWDQDRYFFAFDRSELEPSVCIPGAAASAGVTSIREEGTASSKKILTGDVSLRAGHGIKFETVPSSNAIVIRANKQWNCDCPEDFNRIHPCERAIKSINGVYPREDGNLDIMQGDWMYVSPVPSENKIEVGFVGDVDCCCTACDSLEELRQQLALIIAAAAGP